MTIDTKRPVSVKLAPCEERRRRWLEIEQNLCDAALRMGKEPHLGEGWYRRIIKPELTLLADEIDRLRERLATAMECKEEAWQVIASSESLILRQAWLDKWSGFGDDPRVPELEDEA